MKTNKKQDSKTNAATTPQPGKVYALTGGTGAKCISNGKTWAESEIKQRVALFDEVVP